MRHRTLQGILGHGRNLSSKPLQGSRGKNPKGAGNPWADSAPGTEATWRKSELLGGAPASPRIPALRAAGYIHTSLYKFCSSKAGLCGTSSASVCCGHLPPGLPGPPGPTSSAGELLPYFQNPTLHSLGSTRSLPGVFLECLGPGQQGFATAVTTPRLTTSEAGIILGLPPTSPGC